MWGAAGAALAAGYELEWPKWVHWSIGFGLAWGAFPVLSAIRARRGLHPWRS